jgi:HSP20 family protein
MAETKTEKPSDRAPQQTTSEQRLARQEPGRGVRRWDPGYGAFANPFELMNRMSEEMDRWFDDLTRGAGFARPFRSPAGLRRGGFGAEAWVPRVEAGQRGDTFVVKADLPGLKKEDVEVDLTDDAITIRGERRDEHQEEREGYWRSEREYGHFQRTIPLPEGVIGESAEATFRDGVLEVTVKAPPAEASRGRRLEIREGAAPPRK